MFSVCCGIFGERIGVMVMPIPKVRESCLTRELVEKGHNIDLQGYPNNPETGCDPCCGISCDYIGPKCGNAHNCVDIGVDPEQQNWNL